MKLHTLSGALAAFLLAGATAAHAAAPGYTTVDLNLRTGPDVEFPVIDVIPGGDDVYVEGCLRDESWCDVSWDGSRGWVYSEYLAFDYRGDTVVLPDLGLSAFSIPIIAFAASDYWRRHYVGLPWYRDRHYWYRYKVRPRYGWFAPPRGIRKRGWWRKNYRAPRGVRARALRRWDRPGPRVRNRIRNQRRFNQRLRRFDRRVERRLDRRIERRRDARIERRQRRIERRGVRRDGRRQLRRERRGIQRDVRRQEQRREVRAERRNRPQRARAANRRNAAAAPARARSQNARAQRRAMRGGGQRARNRARAGRAVTGQAPRARAGRATAGGPRNARNRVANRRGGGERRRNRN